MVIAVTGASGHIGNNLSRSLLEKGHEVRALIYKANQGLENVDVIRVKGSITKKSELNELIILLFYSKFLNLYKFLSAD